MPRRIDHDATIEDLTFLANHGVGASEAATRLAFTSPTALDKYLRRYRHNTLATQLARQDYTPLGDHGPTRHKHLRRAS